MNKLMTSDAATFPVLKPWAGERCCAAPVQTVQGTGLPLGTPEGRPLHRTFDGTGPSVVGIYAPVGVLVTDGMGGADQVQTAVRIPAAANGIPPRRTPPRC